MLTIIDLQYNLSLVIMCVSKHLCPTVICGQTGRWTAGRGPGQPTSKLCCMDRGVVEALQGWPGLKTEGDMIQLEDSRLRGPNYNQ